MLIALVVPLAAKILRRYRREVRVAEDRDARMDRRSVLTSFGQVEYTDSGEGEPLLVSHGIYEGCGAARGLRDLFPDRRLVVPSRFGYGGSTLPEKASPAMQADAFVELLDALEIERTDVLGVSAGTTAVIHLALRHADRVRSLIVLSGNLPHGTTAVVQPSWARLVNRQVPVWILKTFFPSTMAFLAGAPRALVMSDADSRFVEEFLAGLFPIAPNVQGIDFDAFVSNADVNECVLEDIDADTTIVHAKDDPLASYESAEQAAARIPRARLIGLESGGHLLLGQSERLRHELAIAVGEHPR